VIRAVVVDDEPPARRRLGVLIGAHADVELVAECADGGEAVEVIRRERPDLVFLDVQMSTLDGLDVARALKPPSPAIIFVTAYDDYAVGAFEVSAVDYLLKPFDEERFAIALGRARAHLADARVREAHTQLVAFIHDLEERTQGVVAPRRRREIVRVADIEIDVNAREVKRGGTPVILRPKLVDLLIALARQPGEVVSRQALLQAVWGYKEDVVSRTLDTHLVELRRRLGHSRDEPGFIETVLKTGYRILA
jgi:DNA-binding response OmpR family regulator